MTRRPHLLFVDDDAQLLGALRDLFRRERSRWDMDFATSGELALEALAKGPVDIVISDLRMPQMDGAALLAAIKAGYPAVTRIVFSGQADQDILLRTIGVAQQFISKPCEAGLLRGTIERALALREHARIDTIAELVGSISHLPSAPTTYLELAKGAASQGLQAIAQVVERDTALSVRVLQLVNSSFFGTRREICAIHEAVGLLGIDLLKALALTASTFSAAEIIRIPGFSLDHEQEVALLGAQLAARIAPASRTDQAFTAGFVRGIGNVVLALGMPGQMARLIVALAERPASRCELERELFGFTSPEVGAYLLGSWGLPFSLVEAVGHHRTPARVPLEERELVGAVHLADALLDERGPAIDHAALPAAQAARLDELRTTVAAMRRKVA